MFFFSSIGGGSSKDMLWGGCVGSIQYVLNSPGVDLLAKFLVLGRFCHVSKLRSLLHIMSDQFEISSSFSLT